MPRIAKLGSMKEKIIQPILRPGIVEVLHKKCTIHPDENLLVYKYEPRKSVIGEFCVRCTKS